MIDDLCDNMLAFHTNFKVFDRLRHITDKKLGGKGAGIDIFANKH